MSTTIGGHDGTGEEVAFIDIERMNRAIVLRACITANKSRRSLPVQEKRIALVNELATLGKG